MRVLLTVHQFLPEHGSGTEILTLETAKALRDVGHEVAIVTGAYSPDALRDEERFDAYVHEGFAVERYRFSPSPIGGCTNQSQLDYLNPLFAQRFGAYLETFRPDVVHVHHLMRLSVLVVDECVRRRIPVVFTPTDFWFVCPQVQLLLPNHAPCRGPDAQALNCVRHYIALAGQRSRGIRLVRHVPDALLRMGIDLAGRHRDRIGKAVPGALNRLIDATTAVMQRPAAVMQRLNAMNRVMVPTRFMGEILTEHGLDPGRTEYLPFGLNMRDVAIRPHKPSKTFRIGYIGTLSPHKGAHVLIDAVRHLLPREWDVAVKIYGKLTDFPDHVQWLKTLAKGDDRIRFMGTFPNTEIGDVFADLDVLVVPSIWYENTPLVIYSAQACGCPVIASDFPGMSEAISHEDNGLLFAAEDWHALAMHLRRLHDDRDFLGKLASRARTPLSMPQYAERLLAVYREVAPDAESVSAKQAEPCQDRGN